MDRPRILVLVTYLLTFPHQCLSVLESPILTWYLYNWFWERHLSFGGFYDFIAHQMIPSQYAFLWLIRIPCNTANWPAVLTILDLALNVFLPGKSSQHDADWRFYRRRSQMKYIFSHFT